MTFGGTGCWSRCHQGWNGAEVLFRCGQRAEGARVGRQCFELRRDELGEEHPDTLLALSLLASALDTGREQEEAERIRQECLGLRHRVLSEEDRGTIKETTAILLRACSLASEVLLVESLACPPPFLLIDSLAGVAGGTRGVRQWMLRSFSCR